MIAALYVETGGCYFDVAGVIPWDRGRDARAYDGPHAVIAHPPCERWGRYWNGGPSAKVKRELGADDGCFAAALTAVRRFGGVLEHPEGSLAYPTFGLHRPPKTGGWVQTSGREWVCCVEQGHYGHLARKASWLLYVGDETPPDLIWGSCGQRLRPDAGFHSAAERARAVKTGACQRLSRRQRLATPLPFRDLLIALATKARSNGQEVSSEA
jgi:hypothetical protein